MKVPRRGTVKNFSGFYGINRLYQKRLATQSVTNLFFALFKLVICDRIYRQIGVIWSISDVEKDTFLFGFINLIHKDE
jgi:hypothetical protein